MASQQQQSPGGGGDSTPNSPAYKRASRKGAPRKFTCDWPDCGKIYSRAEHLHRHQLNHDPKEVYRCDEMDCTQMFVRPDLLARHKKRHSTSYVPRNRASSFSVPLKQPSTPGAHVIPSPSGATGNGEHHSRPQHQHQGSAALPHPQLSFSPQSTSVPRNASVLLTSDSPVQGHPALSVSQASTVNRGSSWAPMDSLHIPQPAKSSFYKRNHGPLHDHSTFAPYPELPAQPFAFWLFDPSDPLFNFGDLSIANIPFLEGGLESPFNNNIHYDRESLTSKSQIDLTTPKYPDMPDESISEYRRVEILRCFQIFRQKETKHDAKLDVLIVESNGDVPALSLDFMRDCVRLYWEFVSPRLPIVHQPTFSSTRCPIYLLLVMIALGAAQIHSQSMIHDTEPYKAFADLIISCVRWEILTAEEAQPPVELWIAQALLLLEFYEKMYSSRRLHERAHIYHAATLTLLRRGSPLIGRAGSESPPDEQGRSEHTAASDAALGWIRWAETEAMHRVVYAAFMMDVVHAAMFRHTAELAPHEIRLPLPCDDSMWSAPTPELTRQNDANFRMYGIKPVSFLDGLKSAIHGKEVQTHSFGRMILMCGLLSVGWHLRHRDGNLKWLESGSTTTDTKEKWCKMLLRAFDDWKKSFDSAMRTASGPEGPSQQPDSNGLIQSASTLYHLAHISLYVDIVDCQVYAGAKRLLGQRISTRDYANVVTRMMVWAKQSTTRRAILNAFKLLHRVLVDPREKRIPSYPNGVTNPDGILYTARNDPDPHRPWITYYAALSIWAFVRALSQSHRKIQKDKGLQPYSAPCIQYSLAGGVSEYLARISNLNELDIATTVNLHDGLPKLLDALSNALAEAHSELLLEASRRLQECKDKLLSGAP